MASAELQDLLEMFAERAMANAEITPTLEERRAGSNLMGKRFENLEGISTESVDADGVPAEWVLARRYWQRRDSLPARRRICNRLRDKPQGYGCESVPDERLPRAKCRLQACA